MPALDLSRHIAAGCLVIQKAETQGKYPSQIWLPSELSLERSRWYHLGPFSIMNDKQNVGGISSEDITEESAQNKTNHILFLDSDIQNQLLAPSGCLAQYAGLLRRGWVHMSFAISLNNPEQGVFRVYMLPDDIDNRRIPRSDSSLRKARLNLLGQLDFSRATWEGEVSGTRYPDSVNFDPEESRKNGEHLSLLHMFNNIPSPNPTPEEIPDLDAREAAYRIMDGGIFGLKTTLYTYQRRSAAMMLQREVQQEQVIDPRLVKVVDQLGNPYYYDAVTGTGLKAPRYYDRPCGGILAEEMGAGKTLICLALILATRHIPSKVPDCLWTDRLIVRRRIGTLLDMAAACLTRNSVPWRNVFGALDPDGIEYPNCVEAIRRNKAWYELPPADRRRTSRQPSSLPSPRKIYLSHTSLVIVPPNLIQQWKQEISKHTFGLKIIILDNSRKHELPPLEELIEYDIVLFSSTRFERMCENIDFDVISGHVLNHPIASIRFKRCIVDEGHKLGNSTPKRKSNIHLLVDHLQIEAKWIVTGTPSKGLFGVREGVTSQASNGSTEYLQTSPDLERDDLKRIGSMATLYLQMRPWANLPTEAGDTPADWSAYVMQPRHSPRSNGRANCLKSTLHSLIIRHQLSEVGELFPTVDEKIVVLDGSYQDRLALNLFAMMIIFNSVQSQRTDQDYFFHPRQRKALIELVSNLRQASFFGGSFFSSEEIQKAVETAEEFLKEGKVPISAEDEVLLRDAIQLGKLALRNDIKRCANLFREVPLYVQNFPWNAGKEWSLNLKDGDLVCTDSRIILALQKFLYPLAESPNALQILFKTGKLAARGLEERQKWIKDQTSKASPNGHNKDQNMTLAGNTPVGQDSNSPMRRRSVILVKEGAEGQGTPLEVPEAEIASVLATTQLVSTASAKLSYLIDQIAKHQEHEQIIVFYENDNVAYYLAGVLEILQIHHLIYAKGLSPERRARYVATFNTNPKFRVLLMDITQAAFGLDMRSASRIYFINPVLNPQVEAQAIGRTRRISQQKPVTVETLVLRGSVEEVIVCRRKEMTQAEQWRCKSILDDKPIYEWILNVKILEMPGLREGESESRSEEQMAWLERPLLLFRKGFGRGVEHPDQDLVALKNGSPTRERKGGVNGDEMRRKRGLAYQEDGMHGMSLRLSSTSGTSEPATAEDSGLGPRKKRRVRFAMDDD